MDEFKIDCVCFDPAGRTHAHITHVGNSAGRWRFTTADAVTHIVMKISGFYTVDPQTGGRVPIGVVRVRDKEPYLRTYADGEWNDNLLAQPECGECRTF